MKSRFSLKLSKKPSEVLKEEPTENVETPQKMSPQKKQIQRSESEATSRADEIQSVGSEKDDLTEPKKQIAVQRSESEATSGADEIQSIGSDKVDLTEPTKQIAVQRSESEATSGADEIQSPVSVGSDKPGSTTFQHFENPTELLTSEELSHIEKIKQLAAEFNTSIMQEELVEAKIVDRHPTISKHKIENQEHVAEISSQHDSRKMGEF